ncbi:MAG: dienelactone hydrolase family protein [Alphaproteobacteria bacterium]|nr:dienelactone hydrolase family protein [Alphaproteobacteria bacterium]MBV8548074.1 dienelactone hydrolase family protein [Alphaproteobacteria bacterium]
MPMISIKSLEGKNFDAYCAMPVGDTGPGLIVIQEIFGVNAGMRAICDHYASLGYIAICPDLFWRQQPGVELTDQTPAEWEQAFKFYKGFDVEAGVRDLLATLGHIRAMPSCSGKVGAIGYCLGGKLAYLVASRLDIDATASYYGVGLESMTGEIHDIRTPLILHIAALDEYTPEAARTKILKAVARNPVVSAHIYENVDHAFARPNGVHFNAEAATLANERTEKLFAENLKT